jgi:beta-carotene ketolase (CrtW type)
VLIQTHLYTGLFITSHDAIHGVVSPEYPQLNHGIGWVCATLFAFNNYAVLRKKHHWHHDYVNTDQDPDVHQGNFFI